MDGSSRKAEIREYLFEDDGGIPNNPNLPLLLYPGVLDDEDLDDEDLDDEDLDASACKNLLAENGWSGAWVNGVFPYHHYHSTAHEVSAGDVVVIPAGVGHFNAGSSGDFTVVGAYPDGQSWDLLTGKPDERPKALENIRNVPLPETDPVFGDDGPLPGRWKE